MPRPPAQLLPSLPNGNVHTCGDPCAMSPPFVHRFRVRYHECDAQGIVFNANHFAYFDVTLTELWRAAFGSYDAMVEAGTDVVVDRKSTRLNSSHANISYAVFCLKKKNGPLLQGKGGNPLQFMQIVLCQGEDEA